jgi:hypothetical protein
MGIKAFLACFFSTWVYFCIGPASPINSIARTISFSPLLSLTPVFHYIFSLSPPLHPTSIYQRQYYECQENGPKMASLSSPRPPERMHSVSGVSSSSSTKSDTYRVIEPNLLSRAVFGEQCLGMSSS